MRVSARTLAGAGAVALALGNLGRIPAGMLGGRTAPVVAVDLVVALLWLVLALLLISGRVRVALDDISTATLVFVAVAALSALLGISRYHLGVVGGLGVAAFLVRWMAYFGWYLFVVWCLTPNEARDAWRYVEWALLAFALFGVLQSAFMPGFAQMVQSVPEFPTWDYQGRRLVSTMLDPNFAGIFIVIALLPRLARVAEGLRERWEILALLVAALLLTVSRSSLLALAVGTTVIAIARGLRLRLVYTFLIGAVLLLPFLSILLTFAAGFHKLGIDTSAAMRFIAWSRGLQLTIEHPIFGVGFNAVQAAQNAHGWRPVGGADVSLDGGLLFVAAMTGLVGLACYLWLLGRVWKLARRVWRDAELSPRDRAHGVATAAVTVAVVVHSFFVNSLLLPFVMQILWIMWGTLMQIASGRQQRVSLGGWGAVAAALPLLVVLGGCDPCSGTNVCAATNRVALAGSIVDVATGRPVSGARIDVQLAGGGSGSATTVSDGTWAFDQHVAGTDSVQATVTVTAPGHAAYTVPAFNVPVSTRAGDATLLGAWTSYPHTHYLATLLNAGQPLAGAAVTFTRTGGVSVTTPTMTATADGNGTFIMDVTGAQPGNVVGTLTVTNPVLFQPSVITNYQIPLDYHYLVPYVRGTFNVGALLAYGGEVRFRGTGKNAGGVQVTFQRTGGIPTTPDPFVTTTDSTGFFLINLTPGAQGVVTGTITLSAPNAAPVTFANQQLATYDSLSYRSLGLFAYGQRWAWAVEIWRNDSLKPVPNLPVTFRRTGGLAITPDSLQLVTGSDGRVPLNAAVLDSGVVNGEITVYPPNLSPYTITGLQLGTHANDSLYFGGVYSYGPSLRYVGEVKLADGTPVVGAHVTWTQTSGIAATPTVLNDTTDANGRFSLLLYPSIEGFVVGTVQVVPPAPWAPGTVYTFTNLQLNSFDSPNLVLAVTYRIPGP